MFSALRQGSTVYILEHGEKLSFSEARVTSLSSPQFNGLNYANGQFGNTINITVDVNGKSRDFGGLPTNEHTVRYNNGGTVVSESREAMITEVDNLVRNSKNVLNNIDYHKGVVLYGEEILANLNPQFAKEKALDNEVKTLHGRVDAMDGKLDKLIALMSNGGTK